MDADTRSGELELDPAPTFGDLLRRHRRAAGLTQEALAERAGLSARAITALERGVNRAPRRETLQLLAHALGLSEQLRAQFEGVTRERAAERQKARIDSVLVPDALPRIVGRNHEVAALERHLAGDGPPVLLFAGEPGIGKTRMLQEAIRRGAATGATVLYGGCDRRSGQDPYTPLPQALERHIRRQTPRELRTAMQGCTWLVRLLPELHEVVEAPFPLGVIPAEQERRLVFNAVTRFLTNLAGPAGVLLVVDDLQWAGSDALALLATLVQSASEIPLRVVGAHRSTEVDLHHPLTPFLSDLARAGLIRVVATSQLAAVDAVDLFARLVENSEPVSAQLMASIVQRSEGVPFFLVSYAAALRAGTFAEDEQADLPWDLAQSVRQRVSVLPRDTQEMLEAAAVIGRAVSASLLAGVMHQTHEQVLRALDAAWRAGLLMQGGDRAYQFAHDVIREAVESDLEAPRCMLLHRWVAEALECNPVQLQRPAEIAGHFEEGDDAERALPYTLLAGDQAEAVFAHVAAERHYRKALEIAEKIGDDGRYVQGLEKLAGVLKTTGRYHEALTVLERVAQNQHDAGDVQGEGRTVGHLAWVHFAQGTSEEGMVERIQSLLQPLEAAGARRQMAELQLGLAHTFHAWGRHSDELRSAERAVDLARGIGADSILAESEMLRGQALARLGAHPEGLAALEEAMSLAEATNHLEVAVRTLGFIARLHFVQGDLTKSQIRGERGISLAERLGNPLAIADLALVLGNTHFCAGDWNAARATLLRAHEVLKATERCLISDIPLFSLAAIYLRQGEWDGASELLEQCLTHTYEAGNAESDRMAQVFLAERDLLQGRPLATINRLEPILAHSPTGDRSYLPMLHGWAAVSYRLPLILGWAHLESGALTKAAKRIRESIRSIDKPPVEGRHPFLVEALSVHGRALARQGRWDKAERTFEMAISRARSMPYPYAEARALYEHGILRAELGEPNRAGALFEQALVIFQRLGARPDVAQTSKALAELH